MTKPKRRGYYFAIDERRSPTSLTGANKARSRHKIYNMTAGKCFYCGTPVICDTMPSPRNWLIVSSQNRRMACEHKIPVIRGGRNHKSNYVPACLACNNTKGSFTIDEFRFVMGLRAGSLSFVFPFEEPKPVRDWLICLSSEPHERTIVLHNMPLAREGYAARRPLRSRYRAEAAKAAKSLPVASA